MSEDFWQELEDEPCDQCGVRPSRSAGHGSYICKPCFASWWCPDCGTDWRRKPHVCPTPEQKAADQAEFDRVTAELDAMDRGDG